MKILGPAVSLVISLAAAHAVAQDVGFPPASTTQPDASAKQEAARRFEHAVKLYEDADYILALAEFERVYQLVPDYRVLYNIGQVNMQLGRYARAHRALREYVERGGPELPADRRSAVQSDLNALDARTARISVEVEPAEAEIWLDGAFVGKSPLIAPLVVDVGERVIQVKLTGYASQTHTLTLAGGDSRQDRFDLQLERSARANPPVATAVPQTAPRILTPVQQQPRASYTWVGWTATSALAVSAGVAVGLGAAAASDLDDLRTTPYATRGELDAARSRTRTRLLVADVLGAAALATGAVTLYFQLSKPAARERPATALSLSMAPNGVALRVAH